MTKLKLIFSIVFLCTLLACGVNKAANNTAASNDAMAIEEAIEEEGNVLVNGQLAPASDYPYCDEVARRVSVSDCSYFQELARRTSEGAGAFNAPQTMRRGESFTVQLVLGQPAPPPPPDQAAGNIAADSGDITNEMDAQTNSLTTENDTRPPPPPKQQRPVPPPFEKVEALPGETVVITPLVGRFMSAELRGQGFRIEPAGPVSKEVPLDSQTSWEWRITALSEGQQLLTLHTVVEGVGSDGRHFPLKSTVYDRVVTVDVGWSGWFGDLLDGLPAWMRRIEVVLTALAALIAAFFAALVAYRRGRRGFLENGPAPPSPPPPSA